MQNVGLLKFGGRTAGAVIEWPRSLNYGNAGRLHETKTTPSAVLQKKCAQMFKIQKSEKMFWLFGLFRMTCGSQLLLNISKCYDTPSPNKLIYRIKSNTYVKLKFPAVGWWRHQIYVQHGSPLKSCKTAIKCSEINISC